MEGFRRVPGTTERAGKGPKLWTYTIFIEAGINAAYGVVGTRAAAQIDRVLADPRGWTRGGDHSFKRVKEGETQVYLAMPDAVDKLCAPLQTNGEVSCSLGTRVVLNIERWTKAVPHWTGSIQSYRQMVVNHEFGHRIGNGHRTCPGAGERAPVMQQQTYGLQGCVENSWPLASEI